MHFRLFASIGGTALLVAGTVYLLVLPFVR